MCLLADVELIDDNPSSENRPWPPSKTFQLSVIIESQQGGLGIEIMHALRCCHDLRDQLLVVVFAAYQVEVGAVDDQQGRLIIVMEERCVGLVKTVQIVGLNHLLGRDAALLDATQ